MKDVTDQGAAQSNPSVGILTRQLERSLDWNAPDIFVNGPNGLKYKLCKAPARVRPT